MSKGEPRIRTRRFASIATLVAAALVLTVAQEGASAPGDTTLVSRSSDGVQGNGRSEIQRNGSAHGAVSADGRYVAFQSSASNLVPGDTNQAEDVFVHDRFAGTTERVSVGTGGVQSNDFARSEDPSISADGRYVAFTSAASNWIPDPDQVVDVFVHDRLTGVTQLVSGSDDGRADGHEPMISADGRYVAFSTAARYFAGDELGTSDVYVWDRTAGTIVDWASPYTPGPGSGSPGSFNPTISADGRYVAFESSTANLVLGDTNQSRDVFVRDRQTGTTELISVDQAGGPADNVSQGAAISADGRYVAFESRANDLVAPDIVFTFEVYVRDRVAGTTERISLTSSGAQAGGDAGRASISADGRLVAFNSSAQLAASDTDVLQDVYVRDRSAGTTLHASVRSDGSNESLHEAAPAAIAADGSMVAFSTAGALTPGDANGDFDVFVHELPAVQPPNAAPTVDAGPDAVIDEAQTFSSSGSFTDPDSSSWTATVDYGDGSGVQPLALSGNTFNLSHLYRDNGSHTVTVNVTDGEGASGADTALVTVQNVAPTVGEITAPADPVAVNTTANASAPFTDPGTLDTHTAAWNWGDGATSSGTVMESGGSGTASGSHAYTVPGVYTITLTLSDDDGGSATTAFQFLVAYDPNGPGVRGRGSILSPPGAYVADPSLTGEAVFGFQSRYRKGATVPSGNTHFKFRLADLSFVSTAYEWLVVSGARAQFKGTGEINGAGTYGFLLTAVDGQVTGGGGVDKFRVKIWDKATGNVVYDNKIGQADSADPQAIADGSIVIG